VVGTNGTLVLGDGFNSFEYISIQMNGLFDSLNVSVKISNDGVNYESPSNTVVFTTNAYKTFAKADLGFRYMEMVQTANGTNSNANFTVLCSRIDSKAKFPR
jgi:hypothetical protein